MPASIPRLRGHWFWGNSLDFRQDRAHFLLRKHEELGDIYCARLLTVPCYFVRVPEIVNAVNVTHWEHFYKPRHVKRLWKPFLGNGLVPNDGESWKRQHKLIRPAFHKQRVDAYATTMVDYTERMLKQWRPGERRDFRKEMVNLTVSVVGKTLFDSDIEDDAETIRKALIDVSELLVDLGEKPFSLPRWWPTPNNRRKFRSIDAIESVIHRMVAERRAAKEDSGDLLSFMVLAADEEGGMSDQQLRDEAMTLIFAGHETTANALVWAWYLLAKNPDKAAALREELDQAQQGRRIEVSDLPSLPYLEQTVKEAMRLIPSVWAYARETIRDVQIGDYFFPKHSTVVVSPFALGRNPKYFEEPLSFRPERWTREFERDLPKGAYVPFAAGPRVCLGKQFAMMEMRMILGTLMQNVEPSVPEGFEADLIAELALHPGERGMPTDVRFRATAPLAAQPAHAASNR